MNDYECPCPCHRDPDHCAICDNDYADLCSPVEGEKELMSQLRL